MEHETSGNTTNFLARGIVRSYTNILITTKIDPRDNNDDMVSQEQTLGALF